MCVHNSGLYITIHGGVICENLNKWFDPHRI